MPRRKRRSLTRLAAGAASLLLVAILAVVALSPRPVAVDLGRVTRGGLRVTLDHEGKTRIRHRYLLSAPVSGRVMRIDLEPGASVEAGRTVVAVLRPVAPTLLDARTRAEARARVQAAQSTVNGARADLGRARAQREHADAELQRNRELARSGVVPPATLEAAESDARALAENQAAAEYALRSAEHELEAASSALIGPGTGAARGGELELRAPITGVVLQRLHESEAVVPAGEPLLEIADRGDLEVVSDYLSADAVQMRPGMPVVIDRWGGDVPLDGAVRLVEPEGFVKVSALGVEEQRVNVITRLVDPWPEWRALGDGYRVETHVVIWEKPNVLKVPVGSLFRQGEAWAVFVDDHGRARRRTVTIGHRGGLEAEVLGGLHDGEGVVLYPPESLNAGARISSRAGLSR
jgi:HlyD family secretion protein